MRKKHPQNIKRVKDQQPKKVDWYSVKKVDWYNVRLTQGQEPDKETQPILWTERPTGALVGAGSL